MADRSHPNKKEKSNERSGRGRGNPTTEEAKEEAAGVPPQRTEELLAMLMDAITRISEEMATLGRARAPPQTPPNGYKILILLALCFMIIIGFPSVGPK
jgi:hypothetical protein